MIKKWVIIGLLGCAFSCTAIAAENPSVHHKHHQHHHTKQSHGHKHSKKIVHKAPIANHQPATDVALSEPSPSLANSIGQHLVKLVRKTVATLRYSVYKLGGTHFDTSRGVYIVDCSDYVDNLLQTVHPDAYSSLVNSSGSYKPTTEHYYDFFKDLTKDSDGYWNKINEVKELRPGDILVFRNKNSMGSMVKGHIMIVMDKPIADADEYLVRVADSAPVGHSEDTREHHVSGIGIGTLLLKVNPETGQPYAYAWKVGSHFQRNVNFAMARPLEIVENG